MAKLPKGVTRVIVIVVVAAIVAAGAYFAFFRDSGNKKVTAQFASAIGVYSGTPVKILGVNVGEVTGVHPGGAYVKVTMEYESKYKLSADAFAFEVANSLVSDRYIQLTPLYDEKRDAGKFLKDGAVIDTKHTGGPSELDDIYAALDKLADALGPQGANKGGVKAGALSTLLKVSAANLTGNGSAIGRSITKLSEAAQTLANQRGNFFDTVRNLEKFTNALHASDGQIRLFNEQLAQVASDLAAERFDLGAALHDLGLALDDIGGFVKQNARKFHKDIVGLKDILGIVVKNKASVNETLAIGPVALANIVHAYQPDIGAIGTRGNLLSLSSTENNDPKTILCSILALAPIDLSKACPGTKPGGLLGGLSSGNNSAGIKVPGLIGAGK